MSSRLLRKLENKGSEELDSRSKGDFKEDELSDSSEAYGSTPKQSFNAFSFLSEDSQNDNEGLDEGEEEFKHENKEDVKNDVNNQKDNGDQKFLKSKKSRKKSKKKAKTSQKSVAINDSDEELDRILDEAKKLDEKNETQRGKGIKNTIKEEYDFEEEMNIEIESRDAYDSNFKYFTTEKIKQSLNLLKINSTKDLDPDQELKNLFGDLPSETIDEANNTSSLAISPEVLKQYRRLARLTRGWGGRDRRTVPGTSRKLLLTKIKDDWLPTSQKLISMEEIKDENIVEYWDYKEELVDRNDLEVKIKKERDLGVRYFKFTKLDSIKERVANTRFYASAIMTPDPESLITLLQQHPYHVETLLQVAMVLLRQGSDKVVSHALNERALFVFDRSFHKNFHQLILNGTLGLIRLPYESFMNRQFYLCLFRYITNLSERSTNFTAFSYCKFLLSLSPAEDPLGVRYFIDHYAILCEEYEYLTKFVRSPLAVTYKKWLTPGLDYSNVLAHFHLGHKEKAKEALRDAFERHPYVAFKLLENLGIAQDLPIKESDITLNEEELLAAETYLVRAGVLWKDSEQRQFLYDELSSLFRKNATSLKSKSVSSLSRILGLQSNITRSDNIPFNLIRFAILSGESKIMAKIPQEVWKRDDLFEYDVLPPKDLATNYDHFTGFSSAKSRIIVDFLLDYVDQSLIGSILQAQTEEDSFAEIIRRLQLQEVEEAADGGDRDL